MSEIRQSAYDPSVVEAVDYGGLQRSETKTVREQRISKCKVFLITCLVIIGLIILAGLIIVLLYVIRPCVFSRCHENAYCINKPFAPKCVCNSGYNGNGRSYCDECGLTYRPQNLKIVGGVPATPHSWPSAAYIISSYRTIAKPTESQSVPVSVGYSCGGTLIDRHWVLTAGHCIIKSIDYTFNDTDYSTDAEPNVFYPTAGSMYKVYLGAHKTIYEDIDVGPAHPYAVDQVILHEDYDPQNILNDIALLKLSEPVDLDVNMQIACLPNPDIKVYPNGSNVPSWVIGWGLESEYGWGTEQLNNVKITIYDGQKCINVSDSTKNWDSQICAGEYEGGKDSCQGDSGGSLFVKDKVSGKEKFISVGVVSYGIGCAEKFLPGIYTRVSYYMDWIEGIKTRYGP